MNQQLLEYIYLNYQPNEYYKKYLVESKQRPDSRSPNQHRTIRISINNNTVTVSRGSTIVIAQLNSNIQQVVYSPITSSYGKQLLTLVASLNMGSRFAKSERNASKAIQNYVNQFINWRHIEDQLVYNWVQKGTMYAHVGQISLQVADEDGCLQQTALLAVQMLLWTAQLQNIQNFLIKGKNQNDQKLSIKMQQFWYGTKYCQILDILITDPTSKQEKSSNYQLTLVSNLRSKQKQKPYRILKVHKSGSLGQQTISAIQKLNETQLSKLALNLPQIQQKCKESKNQQTLTITGL